MSANSYFTIPGGHPPQTELLTGRAVFTQAYAVIPKGVMRDIVTSNLPFWDKTRAWIIARPLSGFAETFAQYVMEVAPGGGSMDPEPDLLAQGALFVVEGELTLLGVVRPVTLKIANFRCQAPTHLSRDVCAAQATTSIDRTQFGMTYGVGFSGRQVDLAIQIEASRD
jgi:glyoxylate utilization-related uncharacterized protein